MKVNEKLNNISLNDDSDITKINLIIEKYNPKVIEISGCPGTGKTTLRNKLKKKYNNKYTNYLDIREKHLKIFNKNISISIIYILFIIKNIPLHYIILKSLKKNKLKNILELSYQIFFFELELKKINNKFIIRDEPLFQFFFNKKFHDANDFIELNTIINKINKIYYKKHLILNIHLIEENITNTINKRKKRNHHITDMGKTEKQLKEEISSYHNNIYDYRFKVNYTSFIDIKIKS